MGFVKRAIGSIIGTTQEEDEQPEEEAGADQDE